MPVSIAVILSIPCALIPPVKALFTPVEGWTGSRMPNAPDGRPPLAWVLETAVFIGGIVIPAGLILLGAGFARLKVRLVMVMLPLACTALNQQGTFNLRGQPIAAMLVSDISS